MESVFLTIGSPTLAAYSLALTILNTRWIARRFSKHAYPNVRNAVRALTSLQQAPLRVSNRDTMLASLIILPQNDKWWRELIQWMQYPHTWSISAVTSVAWVTIAFVFTVVDSFTRDLTSPEGGIKASGQGVGSVWLWLLPIVVGWLQVSPKCDEERLRSAVDRANILAYVAADSHPDPVPARQLTQHRAIYLALAEESDGDSELRADERITAPIYNYSRFLPWVQSVEEVLGVFKAASYRSLKHQSVDSSVDWVIIDPSEKPAEQNRTGNRQQLEAYCDLQGLQLNDRDARINGRWGPNVVSRIAIASLLAILLQWGTVGGAIIVVYYTPTTGLGCRSGSYVLFGALSTLVWAFLLTSSILSHLATGLREGHPDADWPKAIARWFSITLRRLGKIMAALNAILILVTCFFHFGNFYSRCYCNSSVFGRRNFAYNVIEIVVTGLSDMKAAWVGGTCLAAVTAAIFIGFTVTYINPVLPEELQ